LTTEIQHRVKRVLHRKEATKIVGTLVGAEMEPTFRSPGEGEHVRLVDSDGETVALVTRLDRAIRAELRALVTGMKFGAGVGRHSMSGRGAVFGFLPKKPQARQEGCRMATLGRDNPDGEQLLENLADHLGREFIDLLPEQAMTDRETIDAHLMRDWRMGESSLWTSGVINQMNVLPYHRDGNNLDTWSAMPTLRLGMAGGYLHLPEYATVFPCGDGDVTWFFGRQLVHGVTPLIQRKPDAYRYSLVFYALKGMVSCATYAEETARVGARRTARERAEADRIRASMLEEVSDG
jgi:hypothetical protein